MKISVIMCAMNSMPYIMSSVESFKKQKYKDKELVLVYSKSVDNTYDFLKSLSDKNIRKFEFEGPIYSALNFGIKKSRGEIVGILHSDDIFFSELTLNNIAKTYKKNRYDLIYGNILYCEKNNILKIKRNWSKIKLKKKFDLPPHTSLFVKKKIYNKYTYKNEYYISGDTDFLLNIFSKKFKKYYLNKYITIMRIGGISTNFAFIIKKIFEDIKIFFKYNLSLFDYIKKIISKLDQFFVDGKIKLNKYHKILNESSKIKFIEANEFNKLKGKIVSALNLAFISYDYKYKLRTHKYLFWPDGTFSTYLLNKRKNPGRIYFVNILNNLNKRKKIYKKIYILGNLPNTSRKWLEKNLRYDFEHKNFPFVNIENIKSAAGRIKLMDNSLIILTLPTPKQELVGNILLNKYPKNNIICIGGSINILSGLERRAPFIFYFLNLEWLWRLKFDTIRRFKRLFETTYLFFKIVINRKNNIF